MERSGRRRFHRASRSDAAAFAAAVSEALSEAVAISDAGPEPGSDGRAWQPNRGTRPVAQSDTNTASDAVAKCYAWLAVCSAHCTADAVPQRYARKPFCGTGA